MLNAKEILAQLTPATGYSYYIYFSSNDTAEYIQFNSSVGIMTHYCNNSSKKYTQFPCMYRPSTTYPSFQQFTYADGVWTDNGIKGNSTKDINRTEQGAGIDALTWLASLDWIYGNTDLLVYDNNTSGTITDVTTITLHLVPEGTNVQRCRANNIKAAYASKLSDPNQVCGTQESCTIQGSNDWWYRTFLQYDLSEIPLGSTIISAKMYVYCNYWNDNGSQGTTNIARVTSEWDESTLCWNKQPEFEGRYLPASVHAPAVNSWSIWDITRLVQGWCNGSYPNYGLYVANDNEGAYRVNWNMYNYRYDLNNSNDEDDSNNLGTYLLIEYDPDTLSEPVKPPYEEIIDFSNENWKTQREEVFTVTDGTTPFFVDSTFTYNDLPTLRSGSIGHYGKTDTTIEVTFVESGSISFKYWVSSESPDYLRVYVDNVQILSVSGTSMTTWSNYSYGVAAGTHIIKFEYTKDGSVVKGNDAGAIADLRFIGVQEPYPRKYLVRSNSVLYNLSGAELSVVETDELTADVFLEHGLDIIPDFLPALLLTLENPEVLFWQDSDKPLPKLSATLTAIPPVQIITTDLIDMSDVTIKGIESVTVDCDGSPLIAVSFDAKETWKAYDGTDWVNLTSTTSGMSKETIETIPVEQWAVIRGEVTEMYIRLVLSSTDQIVRQIYVRFLN